LSAFCTCCAAAGAGTAIYYTGQVERTLPVSLSRAHEAAVAALHDASLPVLEEKADSLTGHLESEYADGKPVWIDLKSLSDALTEVKVRVGHLGEKSRALDILNRIEKAAGV
jgi:hypothetical protein